MQTPTSRAPFAGASPSATGATPVARRTPGLLLGPYYPVDSGDRQQPLLWHGPGLPAGARHLQLAGRVLTMHLEAVAGARVELWHADPAGKYRHPSACAGVLGDFAGHGATITDDHGRFAFATLEPGPYRDNDTQRAPHLHVQVTGRFDRLVTQLFFAGHPLNAQDRLYRSLRRPELLTPAIERDDPQALHLCWTAVLTRG